MPNIPTSEQAAVISCTAKVQLVDAVAGSGKTTTLAMVARAWCERSGGTGRVACLSFTESAKRRFKQKLIQEEAPQTLVPATLNEFAQFGLSVLIRAGHLDRPYSLQSAADIRARLVDAAESVWRKYEERGGTDFDFAFENNTERIDQLLKILRRLKATLMTYDFDDEEFPSIGIYEMAEQLDVPVEVIEICAAHESMRRRMPGEIEWQTEDDLVPDLVRILRQNPLATSAVPRVSLFLIDEWHDVNAAEFELIQILLRGARLVVVADRDQVIDDTRGAELRFSTDDFLKTYVGATRLPLSKTRRFGASLSRQVSKLTTRRVESIDGLHTSIQKITYDPTVMTSCASAVVDQIQKLHGIDQKTKYSDIAIVIREEDQSIEIENMLLDSGIPYECDGIASYLLRPEILMLRAILHLISGNYAQLQRDSDTTKLMVGSLAMFVSMSRNPKDWYSNSYDNAKAAVDPLEEAKELIAKEPSTLESFFSGVLCKAHDYDRDSTVRWKERFSLFVETTKNQSASLSVAELLKHANSYLDLTAAANRVLLQRSQADSAIRSIQSFISFAEKFPKMDIGAFLVQLDERQKKLSSRTAGQRKRHQLILTTVKSAKGQEWPHVIIPYLQAGEFPRSSNLTEEQRFLYVAMTRAQASLTIAEPNNEFRSFRSPLLHGQRARGYAAVAAGV
jgi:DNA helicase II / ATP-dependent DNA helicase PcrA